MFSLVLFFLFIFNLSPFIHQHLTHNIIYFTAGDITVIHKPFVSISELQFNPYLQVRFKFLV